MQALSSLGTGVQGSRLSLHQHGCAWVLCTICCAYGQYASAACGRCLLSLPGSAVHAQQWFLHTEQQYNAFSERALLSYADVLLRTVVACSLKQSMRTAEKD